MNYKLLMAMEIFIGGSIVEACEVIRRSHLPGLSAFRTN